MPDKITVLIDEDYKDITENYLRNVAKQVETIEQYLTNVDFNAILVETHQMAGSGQSYGFEKITEIARRMDEAAKNKETDIIRPCLQELSHYLDHLHLEFVPEDEL